MDQAPLHDLSEQLRILFELEQDYAAGFALGRHILRHWPRHLDTYAQLGVAALDVGLYADAADLLRRALSANPEAGPLWAALRQAASALGQEAEAAISRQYENDLLDRTNDDHRLLARARHHAATGQWRQALRLYRQGYSAMPQRIDAVMGLATALWFMDRYDACQSLLRIVLADLPFCLKAHLLMALSSNALADSQNATRHMQVARLIDPDDVYAWRWFGSPGQSPPSYRATLPAWDASERWPHLPPSRSPEQRIT